MNTFIIVTISVIVAAIVIYSITKRFISNWQGVLIDKKILSRWSRGRLINGGPSFGPDQTVDSYILFFQTDDGSKINLKVSQPFYDSAVVGSRFIKEKGQYNPQLIEEK